MGEQTNGLGGGYVRVYRKLLENPIWTQLAPAVAKVAMYFLLRAQYKAVQWYDGTAAIEIPAGSFVTSLDKTATACNISKQQARDAFEHLARTHFATYRRTHRWTLVTVLNWATYQASVEDGNTMENTQQTAHGTLNKKERSKEYTPKPPEGVGNGIPGDPDQLRFATVLHPESFPSELADGNNYSAGKNGNGRAQMLEAIQFTAKRIHERHPRRRRDIGVNQVAKKLTEVLNYQKISTCEGRSEFLNQIDRTHAAMCASESWQKDGGEFAKGLENGLAPRKERYLVDAPTPAEQTEPVRRMIL